MALELKDLTDDERLALVALVQLTAEADSYVTQPEAQRLRGIITAVGEKAYEAASDQADERFEDVDVLKAFLKTIDRQEARELIYGAVLDVALSDTRVGPEQEILTWLGRNWHVKVEVMQENN